MALNEYSFGEIYIRHAIDEEPNDKYFSMHIHEQCEIYVFVAGNVEYLVEGTRYPLDENSMMIMRPSEVHRAKIMGKEKYERYALNFPVSFVEDIDPEGKLLIPFMKRELGKNNLFTREEIDMSLVRRLFDQMSDKYEDYDKQLKIKTNLFMLLDMISTAYVNKEKVENKPLSIEERVVVYVNDHLFEEIAVPDLASHFFLSVSQFGRLFKRATGASPWEYIIKKRLAAAKEKIRNGESLQSAAESCGFTDYSAFYRGYIKRFGKAPSIDV